jgi:hypothetical protein
MPPHNAKKKKLRSTSAAEGNKNEEELVLP